MKKLDKKLTDEQLKELFLKYCKKNNGCYILTEDEYEQLVDFEDLETNLDEIEIYGFDESNQELVSLEDVKKLLKKHFKV